MDHNIVRRFTQTLLIIYIEETAKHLLPHCVFIHVGIHSGMRKDTPPPSPCLSLSNIFTPSLSSPRPLNSLPAPISPILWRLVSHYVMYTFA